jgi:hypothetical protein
MPDDLAELHTLYATYVTRLKRELEAAVEDVSEDLRDRMHALVDHQDHSLAELRALGHPYAASLPIGSAPHPDFEAHRQSGQLQDTLRVEHEGTWRGGQVASEVVDDAPYLEHLLYGTDVMRPRDFASAAILQELEHAEARVRRAHAAAGGEVRDDGNAAIEVTLVDHSQHAAELPEMG